MTHVDAILPAAGRISGDFAAEAGAGVKALIELGGRTVLERTIAALRATGRIGRIVVIGPEEVTAHPAARAADAALPEGGESGPSNIRRGLEWVRDASGGHADRVLIVTTDLPFITPEAITRFLDACPLDLDICIPLLRREEFEARFPDFPLEYVRLRDGEWTMGCAFLVNPEAIIAHRARIEQVFALRKSQLGMMRLLGPLFIVRFLLKRLTIKDIEQRCLDILGCTGGAIHGCPPELTFDIDLPREYRYAVEHIG